MPIYAYRCTTCGHEFERLENSQTKTAVECPMCREKTLVSVIKPFAVQFNGPGFHVNDYPSEGRVQDDPFRVPNGS